jgi:CBS domain-containing protein
MPHSFNFLASPFDCLSQAEQRLVRDNIDVAYFPAGETILELGSAPSHLLVIIKGYVTQYDGDDVVASYGPEDCFDGRGLVAGRTSSRFVATEEVLAYELSRRAVGDLIAANATFGALLFSDIGQKLSALAQRHTQHEMHSLTLSRVDAAFVRPAVFVDARTDVVTVVKLFQSNRTTHVLVRDAGTAPPRLGIFTTTALQRAILNGTPLHLLPVGELSEFNLVKVQPSDQIGEALARMLKFRVHRLVVQEGEEIVGVLEALDLFSFLSNHSHLITVQIEMARDLASLREAAAQITRMVALLYRSGMRVLLIARLVQELNARLFERAWQMIAPAALIENSCLFVMGSEGRGEQLLKTDQDNALVLGDGYAAPAELERIAADFSTALAEFGYPVCPGLIMLNNPQWRMPLARFAAEIREWLLMPSPESLMKLAIFLDAHAVCGDERLLDRLRAAVMSSVADNDATLAHFAGAIDAFGTSEGWWNRLLGMGDSGKVLDIKKEGVFPIVHGVRSLALAERLTEAGTEARIAGLGAAGVLTAPECAELSESLNFLLGLRLKAGLAEMDAGQPVTGSVALATLSSLERDLLKDALDVVKRFKQLVRRRFKLDSL